MSRGRIFAPGVVRFAFYLCAGHPGWNVVSSTGVGARSSRGFGRYGAGSGVLRLQRVGNRFLCQTDRLRGYLLFIGAGVSIVGGRGLRARGGGLARSIFFLLAMVVFSLFKYSSSSRRLQEAS